MIIKNNSCAPYGECRNTGDYEKINKSWKGEKTQQSLRRLTETQKIDSNKTLTNAKRQTLLRQGETKKVKNKTNIKYTIHTYSRSVLC